MWNVRPSYRPTLLLPYFTPSWSSSSSVYISYFILSVPVRKCWGQNYLMELQNLHSSLSLYPLCFFWGVRLIYILYTIIIIITKITISAVPIAILYFTRRNSPWIQSFDYRKLTSNNNCKQCPVHCYVNWERLGSLTLHCVDEVIRETAEIGKIFCIFLTIGLWHDAGEGGWFVIFRIFNSILFFVNWISLYFFHFL